MHNNICSLINKTSKSINLFLLNQQISKLNKFIFVELIIVLDPINLFLIHQPFFLDIDLAFLNALV